MSFNANKRVNPSDGNSFVDSMEFLTLNGSKKGIFITNDDGNNNSVINFLNTTLNNSPYTLNKPISDIDKFHFYINGQYLNSNVIEAYQSGSTLQVKMKNSLVGYSLEETDVIELKGKIQ